MDYCSYQEKRRKKQLMGVAKKNLVPIFAPLLNETAKNVRPDGGIGRRASFRDQCPYGRAGSIPVLGTEKPLN